ACLGVDDLYAEVIVDVAARNVDKVFHYRVPVAFKDCLKIGSRVLVPFGNRRTAGFVIGFSGETDAAALKDIIEVQGDNHISEELVKLSLWISQTYLTPKSTVLNSVSTPILKSTKRRFAKCYFPALPDQEALAVLDGAEGSPKQTDVLRAALHYPGLSRQKLARQAGVSVSTVDAALKRGFLKTVQLNDLYNVGEVLKPKNYVLTSEQDAAVSELASALQNPDKPKYFLLHGITGSGKTVVYLAAAKKAVQTGKQVIVLVPEISLTPQLLEEFYSVFGERVAVLHSALSAGERGHEWNRIKEGHADIVIGARSAIFAPVSNPGLIILDEEHEQTYKQEESPRYHAREVALQRAGLTGAVVVLGSATPSLETYCRTLKGGFEHLRLPHRVEKKPLPQVEIVDMREELRAGNKRLFSRALIKKIKERLDSGEQTILFLNRRGYSTFIICRECGQLLKCPHCEISLTYHKDSRLRCHYCNYTTTAPTACPLCSSEYISYLGAGTQRVEREISQVFPQARVLRMDSDTTSRKGAHRRILKQVTQGNADILVGTQMVAKGHNLPGVTLVGVVNADSTLHMSDFRASERTFQLLTQVAGRAGRGIQPGEVIIQTYSPDHYSIKAAQKQDYLHFLREELRVRSSLFYPPFTLLARLMFTGSDGDFVEGEARALKEYLDVEVVAQKQNEIFLLGPSPAAIYKTKDQYRWQIIVKGTSRLAVRETCAKSIEKFKETNKCRLLVDIDPQGI
ncbi:MAG: primosomal protein N', partial [Desulfotomaculaceae bacterium]